MRRAPPTRIDASRQSTRPVRPFGWAGMRYFIAQAARRMDDPGATGAVAGGLAQVRADAQGGEPRFYQRLLELDPKAERLFAGVDLEAQERKLMTMLAEIVQVVDQPSDLVSVVAALGRRHVHYGVHDADYESLGAALLWTLWNGNWGTHLPSRSERPGAKPISPWRPSCDGQQCARS